MRMAPDDEFKLRFPVAKDRTLRRIAIAQMSIILLIPLSLVLIAIGAYLSHPYDPRWGTSYNYIDVKSPFYVVGLAGVILAILTIPSLVVVNLIEGFVLTRRYGWRAMKDPIEAQRVATREALYDVATGSTRAEVEPERDGDRIMVVPVRRLRPVGARLELIAEREEAQAPRQGS
jgi:hypothetical protein